MWCTRGDTGRKQGGTDVLKGARAESVEAPLCHSAWAGRARSLDEFSEKRKVAWSCLRSQPSHAKNLFWHA